MMKTAVNDPLAFYFVYLVKYFQHFHKFPSHTNCIFSKNISYSRGNTTGKEIAQKVCDQYDLGEDLKSPRCKQVILSFMGLSLSSVESEVVLMTMPIFFKLGQQVTRWMVPSRGMYNVDKVCKDSHNVAIWDGMHLPSQKGRVSDWCWRLGESIMWGELVALVILVRGRKCWHYLNQSKTKAYWRVESFLSKHNPSMKIQAFVTILRQWSRHMLLRS